MLTIDISVKEIGKKSAPYVLESDLNGKISLERMQAFFKNAIISIAADVLKEEQVRGFDKKPKTVVDNKPNAPEETVKPFGKIEYISRESITEAVLEIYSAIDKQSKKISGTYSKYNWVFLNGQVVARTRSEVIAWIKTSPKLQTGSRLRFVNMTPYARRLEYLGVRSGKTSTRSGKASSRYVRNIGGKKTKIKVGDQVSRPNGAYFFVSRSLKRQSSSLSKFKGVANKIKFEFLQGSSLSSVPKMNVKGGTARTTFKKDNRPYLYPAIVLDLSSEGIL